MVLVVKIHRTARGYIGRFVAGGEGGRVYVVKDIIQLVILVGNIQKHLQICGGAVRTDRLDGMTVEALIKPAIVIIFTDGRTYDQRVVIKISKRSHTLVFLVRQHGFQTGQRSVILIKWVKKHNRADHRRKENKRSYEKRFDKFSV